MDRRLMDDMQYMARTNLFWLGKEILGYDLVPSVHQPICDFFVQKNPNLPFAEQSSQKQRLVLDPRGHFKTSLVVCDSIQWIINFPDIRLLDMSGTHPLVSRILQETKSHFQFNERFRSLFPEFCPQDNVKDFGRQDSFTVPARTNWKLREPTLSTSTVDSVKAGSHYDVGFFDDLVHEKNVGNREQIAKTKEAFHYTTPLIDPGGYRQMTGTCYDLSDLYADHRANSDWLTHIRSCWKERVVDGKIIYDILFPERFTLRTLKAIQKENPTLFSCQYLNQPMMGGAQQFSEALLNSCFMPRHEFPKESRLYITWDFAFSQSKQADYSVGTVGMFAPDGILYLLDIVRGRFSPEQLANAVVLTARKYHATAVGIENSAGSRLLEPALQYGFRKLNMYVRLDWLKVPHSNKLATDRIMALQPRMTSGRLKILDTIPYRKEMVQEFTRLGKFGHDDIPDAISLLEQYAGKQDIHLPDDQVEVVAAPQYSAAYYGGDLPAGIVG